MMAMRYSKLDQKTTYRNKRPVNKIVRDYK